MESIQYSLLVSSGALDESLHELCQGQKLTVTGKYDNSLTAVRGPQGIFIEMWESPPGADVLNLFHLTQPMSEKEAADVFESFVARARVGRSSEVLELYIWKKGPLPSAKLNSPVSRAASPVPVIQQSQPEPAPPPKHSFAHGALNEKIQCRFCNVKGFVYVQSGSKKVGVSGGKATAAILTGGLSLLAVGLSRKESTSIFHCENCRTEWTVEH